VSLSVFVRLAQLCRPRPRSEAPPPEMLRVLAPMPEGPQITPFLEYQLERAWAFDAKRQERFARVKTEAACWSSRTSCARRPCASWAACRARRPP
jgi:hypothetical protein